MSAGVLFIIIGGLILAAYIASYYYSRYNWNLLDTRLKRLRELRAAGKISEENYQKSKKYNEEHGGTTGFWSKGW